MFHLSAAHGQSVRLRTWTTKVSILYRAIQSSYTHVSHPVVSFQQNTMVPCLGLSCPVLSRLPCRRITSSNSYSSRTVNYLLPLGSTTQQPPIYGTTRLSILNYDCYCPLILTYSIKNAPNKGLKFFYMRCNMLAPVYEIL